MPYNFNYPEERTNPEYKFDEVISDYNDNFAMIESGSTSSSKRLVATLRQSSHDAPVQTDIENSIDGTIVWSRAETGTYKGLLVGGFIPGQYAIHNLKPASNEGASPVYPYYISYLNRLDDDNIVVEVYYTPSSKAFPFLSDDRLDSTFDWTFEYIQKST
jgi:hypothetical protein